MLLRKLAFEPETADPPLETWPTFRIGDSVLAQWGLVRLGHWDEREFHEGRVSAVNEDGSVAVTFSGYGWVEPRVPWDRCIRVRPEPARALSESGDEGAFEEVPTGAGGS